MTRLLGRALPAILGCLLLVGCTSLQGTGDKGYVTGDGTVRQIAAADRGDPVRMTGTGLDGKAIDTTAYLGKPVVVVVWGSWCPPCRAEAPDVVAAAKRLGATTQFVGIDLRDSPDLARDFERNFDVPYPSVDSQDGVALLAFSGTLGPRTIPGFAVLDDQGRVAASIIGSLPSVQTMIDLVDGVAGPASAASTAGATNG